MEKNIRKKLNLDEVIAYECHVKGISADASSKARHKGTFLGLAESLDDIKELGVNQLILLPVYDFEEKLCNVYGVPENVSLKDENGLYNYWGFTKGDYFKLKEKYACKDAVAEYKYLIDEIHKRDMEIIMSIHFDADENTHTMLSAIKYWVKEFLVDGFFLNVNPYYLKMLTDCPELTDTKFYCYDIDGNLRYTNPERIAVYDYNFRNVLRRMLRGDEKALKEYFSYLNSSSKFKKIISVTGHNGFTLNDLYSYNRKHNEANGEFNQDGDEINFGENFGIEGHTDDVSILDKRLKAMKNALTMLLLSKGMPLLLGGDEAGNSQNGNNNAYCQDNETGWVQYNGRFRDELSNTIKTAINIRRSENIFNDENALSANTLKSNGFPSLSFISSEDVSCSLDDFTKFGGILYAENESFLYIALNFDKYEHILSIPHLPKAFKWSMIAGTDVKNLPEDVADTTKLKEQSLQIFMRKKIN